MEVPLCLTVRIRPQVLQIESSLDPLWGSKLKFLSDLSDLISGV